MLHLTKQNTRSVHSETTLTRLVCLLEYRVINGYHNHLETLNLDAECVRVTRAVWCLRVITLGLSATPRLENGD